MDSSGKDLSLPEKRRACRLLRLPDLKTITVCTAHEWRELTEQDHLEFPALFPGVSIRVSAIFEGI
jgi:hypothetical protein